uniref:Uncharacterized protein n=1 Tax=Ciona intestinalis TaxID=7719 RepID=H2Y1L2_CIOIN
WELTFFEQSFPRIIKLYNLPTRELVKEVPLNRQPISFFDCTLYVCYCFIIFSFVKHPGKIKSACNIKQYRTTHVRFLTQHCTYSVVTHC